MTVGVQRGSGGLPVGAGSFGKDKLLTNSKEATTFSHKCEWSPVCEWATGLIHQAETIRETYDRLYDDS